MRAIQESPKKQLIAMHAIFTVHGKIRVVIDGYYSNVHDENVYGCSDLTGEIVWFSEYEFFTNKSFKL